MIWLEHIEKLPQREIMPGMRGRFLHSDAMTFAFWEIDGGFELPEHHHPHEQVAHMIEGSFALTVNGETKQLEAGAVTVIPGNVPHSGKAITDCRILDIFYPKREDYELNG
jgi:quercetin dioxygenase-like cupin family protein